jgi:hypothetical protein
MTKKSNTVGRVNVLLEAYTEAADAAAAARAKRKKSARVRRDPRGLSARARTRDVARDQHLSRVRHGSDPSLLGGLSGQRLRDAEKPPSALEEAHEEVEETEKRRKELADQLEDQRLGIHVVK